MRDQRKLMWRIKENLERDMHWVIDIEVVWMIMQAVSDACIEHTLDGYSVYFPRFGHVRFHDAKGRYVKGINENLTWIPPHKVPKFVFSHMLLDRMKEREEN